MNGRRILVLTGAGVSAESGIPTFRGKNGYWRNLDPAKLATPEAFAKDPGLVWEWYRERRRRIRAAQPNPAHKAIAKLAQHAHEFLLVTQNVDDLHARAGSSKEKMVQIHGYIFVTRCSRCGFERNEDEHDHEQEHESEHERESEDIDLPRCTRCSALMRPGVAWFGEQLPSNEVQRVENYLKRGPCDYVVVVGTTATFGYIIDWALQASRDRGELIEVNPNETPLSEFATKVYREPATKVLPRLVNEMFAG